MRNETPEKRMMRLLKEEKKILKKNFNMKRFFKNLWADARIIAETIFAILASLVK